MRNQFARSINKPLAGNTRDIIPLCKRIVSPRFTTEHLPPLDVVLLNVVPQFGFLIIKTDPDDVKSLILIGTKVWTILRIKVF